MGYNYPAEAHANSKDTTYIDGNLFGKDKIFGNIKYYTTGLKHLY